MANSDNARGIVPVAYLSGAPYNGAANVYYVPSSYNTALYVGDPVVPVNASADAYGIPTVARASAGAGNYILGAMVGIVSAGDPVVSMTRDSTVYHAASTEGYILVADDPNLLFEAQEDGVGGAMGAGAASRNVDLIAGTGSTTTGYSGFELDSNTLGTGATLQMRILRPAIRADNDPTLTNAKWLVKINLHSIRYATGV